VPSCHVTRILPAMDDPEARDRGPAKRDRTARLMRVASLLNAHPEGMRPKDIAERLGILPGDLAMRTRYVFRDAGEPMMLSTSWEPLEVTGRSPVMLPEEGPLGGCGVVERMAAINIVVDNVVEVVGARPGLAEELLALGGVPGHVVMVLERTYYASGRAVETADVVIPADRYRLAYHLPVR